MITWLLQKNLTNPNTLKRIKTALHQNDVEWQEMEIIPFSKDLPKIENTKSTKVVYSSTTFMLNAFHNEAFRSAVFYHPNRFNMKNYVKAWGNHVLNYDGELLTLGTLKSLQSKETEYWFLRPNHDGKEFAGRVEVFSSILEWSEKICQLKLPDLNKSTEIWIAPLKKIQKEWRLFIVNNKIISTSQYMLNGRLKEDNQNIPPEMIAFAKDRIQEYRLDDIYVIDIAKIEDEYKIIECSSFNGTGFYQHNIEKCYYNSK